MGYLGTKIESSCGKTFWALFDGNLKAGEAKS
jgi:hypothetical protein